MRLVTHTRYRCPWSLLLPHPWQGHINLTLTLFLTLFLTLDLLVDLTLKDNYNIPRLDLESPGAKRASDQDELQERGIGVPVAAWWDDERHALTCTRPRSRSPASRKLISPQSPPSAPVSPGIETPRWYPAIEDLLSALQDRIAIDSRSVSPHDSARSREQVHRGHMAIHQQLRMKNR